MYVYIYMFFKYTCAYVYYTHAYICVCKFNVYIYIYIQANVCKCMFMPAEGKMMKNALAFLAFLMSLIFAYRGGDRGVGANNVLFSCILTELHGSTLLLSQATRNTLLMLRS
jgi:hypothetical protein